MKWMKDIVSFCAIKDLVSFSACCKNAAPNPYWFSILFKSLPHCILEILDNVFIEGLEFESKEYVEINMKLKEDIKK